jgi:hypothetical protein
MGIRNVGSGLALLHGWVQGRVSPSATFPTRSPQSSGASRSTCTSRLVARATGRGRSEILTTRCATNSTSASPRASRSRSSCSTGTRRAGSVASVDSPCSREQRTRGTAKVAGTGTSTCRIPADSRPRPSSSKATLAACVSPARSPSSRTVSGPHGTAPGMRSPADRVVQGMTRPAIRLVQAG